MILRVTALAAILWLLAWGGIVWYVTRNDSTSQQLCHVLSRVIENSDSRLGSKGTAGYAYYSDHPDELQAAHKATAKIIKDLPCR